MKIAISEQRNRTQKTINASNPLSSFLVHVIKKEPEQDQPSGHSEYPCHQIFHSSPLPGLLTYTVPALFRKGLSVSA
jgi:hypothetical protein